VRLTAISSVCGNSQPEGGTAALYVAYAVCRHNAVCVQTV
jgi:hypothetical protein